MTLIGLNATFFRAEKNILVVESRDSSLESSVPSSVLSWCFWDVLANSGRSSRLDRNKISFYVFACCTAFKCWNFVLVRNMELASRNEFASSNFVAGSPYSHTFLAILNVVDKAHNIPFHWLFDGKQRRPAFAPRTPPNDSIASCIWDTDSISRPEFNWMAIWDLIVADCNQG